jgi:hypothetical protein
LAARLGLPAAALGFDLAAGDFVIFLLMVRLYRGDNTRTSE